MAQSPTPSRFDDGPDWTAPTEVLLARAAATDDAAARDSIHDAVVLRHYGLARSLAARYAGRGEAMEDLQQVARLGLVHAVHRFDPTHDGSFPSFAVPTILGELRRHFRDHSWAVRPPRRLQELRPLVLEAQERLTHELGRAPNVEEVAAAAGAGLADTVESLTLSNAYQPESLDAPVPGGDTTLAERLTVPDQRLQEVDDRIVLAPALGQLSRRTRQVLDLHYLQEFSQRQIADRIGVSQMQVSRIIGQALREVRSRVGGDPGR